MWYMTYVTRPFEYIHMDFVELPMPTNGKNHVLVITDDFTLTTVLCNTEKNDVAAVVHALLDEYLCVFPDPDLLHSDGGSHFDNA